MLRTRCVFTCFRNSTTNRQIRERETNRSRAHTFRDGIFRAQHMPEIIISIYVHVYMFFTSKPATRRVRDRIPNSELLTPISIGIAKRSFSFDVHSVIVLYSLFHLSCFDYCGALAIIASLECSISIHFTECIGTLLTKLIRTYVQLILFLRVANQLHIAFDKQMKESPINWRVTRNKRIKFTTNSKQTLVLCHVICAIAFIFL